MPKVWGEDLGEGGVEWVGNEHGRDVDVAKVRTGSGKVEVGKVEEVAVLE